MCLLTAGCLADWSPPSTGGWAHEAWFAWTPVDERDPTGPGRAWRWIVPEGVTRVTVTAWGAGGGGSVVAPEAHATLGHPGGAGGLAIVELDVEPGQAWVVVPGRGGLQGGARGAGVWTAPLPTVPWLGGGGPGAPIAGSKLPRASEGDLDSPGCRPLDPQAAWICTGAGAGGGWSGVFLGETLDDAVPGAALLVAGGGGGGGAGGAGGDGGGAQGVDAPTCGLQGASMPGRGGQQDAGGAGGVRAITLDDPLRLGGFGAPLLGGSGGHANPHMGLIYDGGSLHGGGGGGGGWFGGSGGTNTLPNHPGCGGGGGSGWAAGPGRLSAGAAPAVAAEAGAVWGAGGVAGAAGGHGGVRIQW